MPYADPTDVRRLLEREDWRATGLSSSEIAEWIDDANLIVEEDVESAATDQGITLTERRLTKIEAALAGHLMLSSGIDGLRQTRLSQAADGAMEQYEGTDTGTTLGDQAVTYDPTGVLRRQLVDGTGARVVRDSDRHSGTVTPGSED